MYRKPVVALLSTGNELLDLQQESNHGSDAEQWSGIWDTNRPSLQAALEGLGYQVIDLGIVHDRCLVQLSLLSNLGNNFSSVIIESTLILKR